MASFQSGKPARLTGHKPLKPEAHKNQIRVNEYWSQWSAHHNGFTAGDFTQEVENKTRAEGANKEDKLQLKNV